ncbi:AzlC family ABC transporter permease [Streptomyces sp. LRE541]|uniref:AzlC family ABC transporter permease n=1 Tax=Streptomyces sp. LRE541 TaxID=2931983 RepID=UPI00200CDE36|nr:AzlC family ABC transporter permease [Streptomyces sp. LRE541]UPZ27149.1 AzlC family ABC transporter permease [Streptomyces sp. LRE541]
MDGTDRIPPQQAEDPTATAEATADATAQGAAGASRRQGFVEGVKVGTGLAAAAFVLAVTFGAFARSEGWGILAPVVCSLVVFSGSAQFALATALAGGGGVPTAIAAAALINGRFVPMGVAVARDLRGGRFRRALEGQAVVDGSWVAAHLGGGRFDRYKLFGATAVQWPAWVAGTALGVVVAPPESLVESLGLDVVFPAFFLLLLMDELRGSRAARTAAALGACLAAALVIWVPAGLALLGASAAALLGLRKGLVPRDAKEAGGS